MVDLSKEFLRQANQAIRNACFEWSKVLSKINPQQHKRKRTKWKNRSKK